MAHMHSLADRPYTLPQVCAASIPHLISKLGLLPKFDLARDAANMKHRLPINMPGLALRSNYLSQTIMSRHTSSSDLRWYRSYRVEVRFVSLQHVDIGSNL